MHTFIELAKAVIYGVLEGITEWLPISSTGHLILLSALLPMKVSGELWDVFLVTVQLGAVLAAAVVFRRRIIPLSVSRGRLTLYHDGIRLWRNVAVACIPCVVYKLVLDPVVGDRFYSPTTVAIMLILVGILFLLAERRLKNSSPSGDSCADITASQAALIGCFQLVAAVFPGTSRSGATIVGGLLLGLSRATATEFTFVLAVPVMAGESLLRILDFGLGFAPFELVILALGAASAFLVSFVAIGFLCEHVKKRDFTPFAVYRILLGVAVLAFFTLRAG